MILQQWREAIAFSLVFNLALFSLFASFTEKTSKDVEYVPVDVIQLSRTPEKEQPPDIRPSPPVPAPETRQEQKPEPPVEKEIGLDKTGEEIPPPPPQTQTAYLPQHRVTKPPTFKTQVKPVYPSSERGAGVEARVLVEVSINQFGGVDEVKVVKSGGPAFDEAVIKAVKASSFNPGYMEGKMVGVRMQIPYVFKMR